MSAQSALFLDRDGVINIDKGYVHKAEDCIFIDGIFDLVKRANQLSYKVFVVTNQAGIARGYYTEAEFLSFSEWMKNEFKNHQAQIDEIYFCPHHPIHGIAEYLTNCDCRKPAPGLFLKAQLAYAIDMKKSVMVGDNISDLDASMLADVNKHYLFISKQIERKVTDSESQFAKDSNIKVISSFDEVDLISD